ncbi:hypothetical protein C0995_013117 [Termitomyces sp. Mi166|nr:hypothetical protein C0995_013117 [Termitomyces sp. Mi166\
MPPRHGKKLADVLDEAFKNNGKGVDEVNAERDQGDAQSEAPAAPLNAETASTAAKPQNSGKMKGSKSRRSIPHNRASVAFVPKRHAAASQALAVRIASLCTKNAPTALAHLAGDMPASLSVSTVVIQEAKLHPLLAMTAVRQNSNSPSVENDGVSAEPGRTKRKQPAKAKQTDAAEGGDDEDAGTPVPKKRRVSGGARANALKDVAELEAAIKKLQSSVTEDLKHLAQLAANLSTQLK